MINTKHAPKKPAQGDWPPHLILYHLYENGTSYARVSRLNGYCSTAAMLVNFRQWPKMEAIIAKAIGVTPQEIWPSRYNEDGTPKLGAHTKQQRLIRARNKSMAQQPRPDNVQVDKAA
jgi:Ner family transcriptional regulator